MARVASPTFVGRLAELAVLDEALEHAAAGQTMTILISGDAGVGKSRLLRAWNEQARSRGARVAMGSCLDLGATGPAYTAVIEALRDLLAGLQPDEEATLVGPDRSVLARLVPELLPNPDRLASSPPSGFAQTRLFSRLVDVLERATTEAPVVLELEDIHWADPSSQAFLLYVVEAARDARLLVIGTYRPEAADLDRAFRTTLGQLVRRPRVGALFVGPFDEAELRSQLTGILGRPPSTSLLSAILARSEGNPLFAEELAAARDPSVDLPASITSAATARLDTLTPDAQLVLRVASVIGRTAEYRVIRTVSGLDDAPLDAALRAAVRSRFIEPLHVGEAYRFRHALLQDAVYDETLPGERRRLHEAVARALTPDSGEPPDDLTIPARLARHWSEAGDDQRAFAASRAAAAVAEGQTAYAEAAAAYERMIALWDRATDAGSTSRVDVLERASWAAFLAGDYERSEAHTRATLAELDRTPDADRRVRVLDQLSWAQGRLGSDSLALLDEVADTDPTGLSEQSRILIGNYQAIRLETKGQHAAAIKLARPLVDDAWSTGDVRLYFHLVITLADLVRYEDADAAIEILAPAREVAARTEDDVYRLDLEIAFCRILADQRRHDQLIAAARPAIDLAMQSGLGRWARPILRCSLAESHLWLGDLRESVEQVELALEDEPTGRYRALLNLVAGLALIAMGAFDEAGAHLQASTLPNLPPEAELGRGWLATAKAKLALARHAYTDVHDIVTTTGPRVVADGAALGMAETAWWLAEVGLAAMAEEAELARARGDEAAAGELIARVPELTGYVEDVREQIHRGGFGGYPTTPGFEALIAGHVARIEGRDEPGLWQAAASRFAPRSVEGLTARYRQSEAMLATRAGRDEVQAVMAPAHQIAVEIGARSLAHQFEALARRARLELTKALAAPDAAVGADSVPTDQADAPAGYVALRNRGLSDREIEVLTLVAAGQSNHQIAERLFISDKTASVHVSHILGKLDVSTRVEAATIGVRLGLPEDV